jgi:hypothetical protein
MCLQGATALILVSLVSAAAANPAMDALVAAYPDHLERHDGTTLFWRDGTTMPISDERPDKNFDELLDEPSIIDQFSIPYRLGSKFPPPGVNEDPGRIRNEAFFKKMYGDCRTGEVTKRLKPVPWMPKLGGGVLMVTTVNGVADKLAAVVQRLEKLPPSMTKFLVPSAGTYNCRPIAETSRLSVHSYGAAIDVSTRFSDYWLWEKNKQKHFVWKNRIPLEIVEAFEREGFIWGGKWYHFDTMHFEYRPELTSFAAQGWPLKSGRNK